MDNLRGLKGIRRMDRVPNTRIREFCKVRKCLDERIYESFVRWFGHVKRIYVGECAGGHSVGRPWKIWNDTVKECLKKRGLDVK